MTDYRALAAEELLPEYNGMTDAQKVVAIKTKLITTNQNVDPGDWFNTLINAGVWGKIAIRAELALRTNPTGSIGSPSAVDILAGHLVTFYFACRPDGASIIHTANETVRQTFITIIQALVAATYFDTTVRDMLAAFTRGSISRAVQLGFPNLTIAELLAARKVVAGG